MFKDYICALDIGSSKIAAVVGQVRKKRLVNMSFDSAPIRCVERGSVVDSIELVGCVSRLLKNLKARSGINFKFVYANISGQDVFTRHSRAIIPLAERGNKVITVSDMRKVNEQALILGSSLDEEIIHPLPFGYAIDSNNSIKNPVGLYSHRLEVDLFLVCAKTSCLQGFVRAVNKAGYEIKDMFFSGMATSAIAMDRQSRQGINVFCDIGCDITELLFFNDGVLSAIQILPLGGADLTGAIAEELKMPLDLAEEIKVSYGSVGDYSHIKEDKEVLVRKSNMYRPIRQRQITQILTAQAEPMCRSIKEAVDKSIPGGRVNNLVAAGRTTLLEGFLENLENIVGCPCRLGRVIDPDIAYLVNKDSNLSGRKYLTYLTGFGIVSQALKPPQPRYPQSAASTSNPILKAINKAKEIYQEYF